MVELADEQKAPSNFVDAWKRFFLGKPLINEDLEHESLSNPIALGALSPDAVSSTAYGPEQILIELLPAAGLAAFTLILPLGGVILLILALVTASYRQVVMVYTQRGGSYVVARANFGPKVAQLSSAALLIDYVVTVAIQCSAGTVAVVSASTQPGPVPPGDHRGSVAAALVRQPARHEGGRPALRRSRVRLRRDDDDADRDRCGPRNPREPAEVRPGAHRRGRGGSPGQRLCHGRDDIGAVALVRQRWYLVDRCRGDRRRGQCLPPAAGPERPQGADHDGVSARIPVVRRHLAGSHHPRHAIRRRIPVDAVRDRPGSLRQVAHRTTSCSPCCRRRAQRSCSSAPTPASTASRR